MSAGEHQTSAQRAAAVRTKLINQVLADWRHNRISYLEAVCSLAQLGVSEPWHRVAES